MEQCRACGRENPDDADFCNKCGIPLGVSNPPGRTIEIPSGEKTIVMHGLASTTVLTKSDLNIGIVFEIILAIACIVGGVLLGQPWWGLGLGLIALGIGYAIYLMSKGTR